jgi:hypothetical protein
MFWGRFTAPAFPMVFPLRSRCGWNLAGFVSGLSSKSTPRGFTEFCEIVLFPHNIAPEYPANLKPSGRWMPPVFAGRGRHGAIHFLSEERR